MQPGRTFVATLLKLGELSPPGIHALNIMSSIINNNCIQTRFHITTFDVLFRVDAVSRVKQRKRNEKQGVSAHMQGTAGILSTVGCESVI